MFLIRMENKHIEGRYNNCVKFFDEGELNATIDQKGNDYKLQVRKK